MAKEEHLNQYAIDLAQRFEELIQWAIENWPNKDFPLMQSDFVETRKEIANIVGPKLGMVGGNSDEIASSSVPDDPQYIDMKPAPWP